MFSFADAPKRASRSIAIGVSLVLGVGGAQPACGAVTITSANQAVSNYILGDYTHGTTDPTGSTLPALTLTSAPGDPAKLSAESLPGMAIARSSAQGISKTYNGFTTNAGAGADLNYFFSVTSDANPGAPVSVNMYYSLVGSVQSNNNNTSIAQAAAGIYVAGYRFELPSTTCSYSDCKVVNVAGNTATLAIVTNRVYEVDMRTSVGISGDGFAAALADPYFYLSSDTLARFPDLKLQISANVGNADPRVSALPEAATWAMMIGGFGVAGGALRRRRSGVAVA